MNNEDYKKLFDAVFIFGGFCAIVTYICNVAADQFALPWLRSVGFAAILLAIAGTTYYKLRRFAQKRSVPASSMISAMCRKVFRPESFGKVHVVAIILGVVIGAASGSALQPFGGDSFISAGTFLGIVIFVPVILLLIEVDTQQY
jgi:hypothetical protein